MEDLQENEMMGAPSTYGWRAFVVVLQRKIFMNTAPGTGTRLNLVHQNVIHALVPYMSVTREHTNMNSTTDAAEFISLLTTVSSWPVYEFYDDTYEVESDHFSMTFVIHEQSFEIRSINTRGNEKYGRRILEVIHAFADDYCLDVFASNVQSEARGFWRSMGYEEGTCSREFFRCV